MLMQMLMQMYFANNLVPRGRDPFSPFRLTKQRGLWERDSFAN